MKAPNNAICTEALEQLHERAGVDDAAVGQRRQELLVQQIRRCERLGHLGAHFAPKGSHLRKLMVAPELLRRNDQHGTRASRHAPEPRGGSTQRGHPQRPRPGPNEERMHAGCRGADESRTTGARGDAHNNLFLDICKVLVRLQRGGLNGP